MAKHVRCECFWNEGTRELSLRDPNCPIHRPLALPGQCDECYCEGFHASDCSLQVAHE